MKGNDPFYSPTSPFQESCFGKKSIHHLTRAWEIMKQVDVKEINQDARVCN
jgi:hypothetical protein